MRPPPDHSAVDIRSHATPTPTPDLVEASRALEEVMQEIGKVDLLSGGMTRPRERGKSGMARPACRWRMSAPARICA